MNIAYPELVSEMAKRRLTKVTVANGLGISPKTLYSKIMGLSDFTLSEASTLHTMFFPEVNKEVLFRKSATDTKVTVR